MTVEELKDVNKFQIIDFRGDVLGYNVIHSPILCNIFVEMF